MDRMKTAQKSVNISSYTDILYLSVTALYLLKVSFDTTLFYIPWPPYYESLLRVLLCFIIYLRLSTLRPGNCQNYGGIKLSACLLCGVMFKLSWSSTEYTFLLDILLLSAGAIGIAYKKLLKVGFWIELYVLILAVIGSFSGCITNLVYSSSSGTRHAFGIVYPTDFAAHVVFLILVGWELYGNVKSIFQIICVSGIGFFMYYYTSAKCSTIVLILFILCLLFCFIREYFSSSDSITKQKNSKNKPLYLRKGGYYPLIYATPLCAFLIIGFTFFYNSEITWMSQLNTLLSNRLSLGRDAMDNYGIQMLGTPFALIGFGGGIETRYDYNFVDSSFVLIMVRYGLIILLPVCCQYVRICKAAVKNQHKKLIIILILISIHCMIEHHLLEPAYNLLSIFTFADFGSVPEQHTCFSRETTLKHTGRRAILYLIAGGITIFLLPKAVGSLRTLIEILNFNNIYNHTYFIILITVCLLTIFTAVYAMGKIVSSFIKRTVLSAKNYILAIAPLSVIVCAIFLYRHTLTLGQEEYTALLAIDKPVINALLTSGTDFGKLYVDHFPELYIRDYGKISRSILAVEGSPLPYDTTLITDNEQELQALLEAGYVYGEITPQRAVYTNSKEAQKILEEKGFTFVNYFNKSQVLDLAVLAAQNSLKLTENDTLLLSGNELSLVNGPGESICRGWLQVEYTLRLLEGGTHGDVAATAQISSHWKQKIWKQEDILISDFDENGQCSYTLTACLHNNCSGVEFPLFLSDGVELEVLEIKFKKVG